MAAKLRTTCVSTGQNFRAFFAKKLGGVGGSLEVVVRVLNLHCLEVVGGSVLLCVRPLLMLSLEL